MLLTPSQDANKMQMSIYFMETLKSKTLRDKQASGLSVSKAAKFNSGQSIPGHWKMILHTTAPGTLLPCTNQHSPKQCSGTVWDHSQKPAVSLFWRTEPETQTRCSAGI